MNVCMPSLRRGIAAILLVAGLAGLHAPGGAAQAASAAPASAGWVLQSPASSANLLSISCWSATNCIAVGSASTILATTTGGTSWIAQRPGTKGGLYGISCPLAKRCIVVGFNPDTDAGVIQVTTNGGAKWSLESDTVSGLSSVRCVNGQDCFAVGQNGTILATTNGGAKWTMQKSGTTTDLHDVSCAGTSLCYAVGDSGTILATRNGGASWHKIALSFQSRLAGIDCTAASTCYAVGESGDILTSHSGGAKWSPVRTAPPSGGYLVRIDCPTAEICYAVGDGGSIVATADGGKTWTAKQSDTTASLTNISCVSAAECIAVGAQGTVVTTGSGTSGSASSAAAPLFRSLLPRLATTKVPAQLPTIFPELTSTHLYATLSIAKPGHYMIEVDFSATCNGADACHYADLEGVRAPGTGKPAGSPIKLTDSVTGYFRLGQCGASCAESTITWDAGGFRYTAGAKLTRTHLIAFAASAAAS